MTTRSIASNNETKMSARDEIQSELISSVKGNDDLESQEVRLYKLADDLVQFETSLRPNVNTREEEATGHTLHLIWKKIKHFVKTVVEDIRTGLNLL